MSRFVARNKRGATSSRRASHTTEISSLTGHPSRFGLVAPGSTGLLVTGSMVCIRRTASRLRPQPRPSEKRWTARWRSLEERVDKRSDGRALCQDQQQRKNAKRNQDRCHPPALVAPKEGKQFSCDSKTVASGFQETHEHLLQ